MNTQYNKVLKVRAVRCALLSLLLGCGLFTFLSVPIARAAVSSGRACIIFAPNGVVPGGLIGHVGWAYFDGNNWVEGATEGTGAYNIGAGGDTHSWSTLGTWFGAVSSFENSFPRYDGVVLHPANYYTQYRCINVSNANSSAASAEVQKQASNGYNGLFNNCLTKAIAILKAYGVMNLPSGSSTAPNYYFQNKLTSFEGVQYLPPLLQVLVALNDVNGQPINTHPLHSQRPMLVQVYNGSNQLVLNQQVTASQLLNSGKYFANIVLSNSWTGGNYLVKVRLDYTLRKLIPGIPMIANGQETILPLVPLIAGDIDQNNQMDLQDYNILLSCFGSKQCPSSQKSGSDINDDGTVDGSDYNLWLRIYSSHPGGS